LAQLNAKRATELRKADLIAPADNDKAIADLHQAEAQVLLREAALERARVDLKPMHDLRTHKRDRYFTRGGCRQTVAASLSAPTLFIIANDLSKMQIDALVSEADIGGVEVDQPTTFIVEAFPTRNFSGKVTQIRYAPSTNQNVVSYDTVISVDNRDLKLKPGMTATASIIVAEREDVFKIQIAALRFKPPEPADKSQRLRWQPAAPVRRRDRHHALAGPADGEAAAAEDHGAAARARANGKVGPASERHPHDLYSGYEQSGEAAA